MSSPASTPGSPDKGGDDEALYARFRDARDEAALAALVARHWDRTYRIALGLVRVLDKKVSFAWSDVPLSRALDDLARSSGFFWRAEGSRVLFSLEAPPVAIAGKKVTLALVDANVSDLVAALASQGVEAVASEEAWRSSGTFSFAAKDAPLAAVLGGIALRTGLGLKPRVGLELWIAEQTPAGKVVVISGEVPSVRDALAFEAPAWPRAKKDHDALRAALVAAVAAYEKARSEAGPAAAVAQGETALHGAAALTLASGRRLGRLVSAQPALAAKRAERDSARAAANALEGHEDSAARFRAADARARDLDADVQQLEHEAAVAEQLSGKAPDPAPASLGPPRLDAALVERTTEAFRTKLDGFDWSSSARASGGPVRCWLASFSNATDTALETDSFQKVVARVLAGARGIELVTQDVDDQKLWARYEVGAHLTVEVSLVNGTPSLVTALVLELRERETQATLLLEKLTVTVEGTHDK